MIPLTQTEIEKPRTASEILPWVLSKIDEIRSADEGKWAINFRRGLAKVLIEESYPLGYFAQHYFQSSDFIEITQFVGSQGYDAQVTYKGSVKTPVQFLEITQAHAGYNEYLRMVVMKEKGHVSLTGTVHKEGTIRQGLKVEVDNEARERSDIIAEQVDRIRSAFFRKTGKNYPEGTALIIAIDDFITFREPDEKNFLVTLFSEEMKQTLKEFVLVSLVGISGACFITLREQIK